MFGVYLRGSRFLRKVVGLAGVFYLERFLAVFILVRFRSINMFFLVVFRIIRFRSRVTFSFFFFRGGSGFSLGLRIEI